MSLLQLDRIYEILFQTASEGLIVTDSEGTIQVSNPRIAEMFGYKEVELLGQKIECLIPKKFHHHHVNHRTNYSQNPVKRTMGLGMNLSGARKDGSVFPVEISLNHFKLSNTTYIMALVSDITERKKAEDDVYQANLELEKRVEERTKELNNSQLLYRLMARNFPNGTINIIDMDFNYVFVEGQELHRHGITAEKLIGTNYLDRIDSSIRERIKDRIGLASKSHNTSFEIEFNKNQYLLNTVGLHNEHEVIDKILIVEQNITQQKQAEIQVREALHKEQQLNELKSRFVSMASHEFRTPLSTILSSASLLQKYTNTEQQERRDHHIHRIKSSVHNLTSILNDFLSLDKLEAGQTPLQLSTTNIDALLMDIVEDLQMMAGKDQRIIYHKENLLEEITTDKLIVRNIVNNLLSNAIKYSKKDIQLKVTLNKSNLIIAVQDQGIGIPKDEHVHIFDRLFRAKNVTNIQGTGLGLNIVSKYVKLLQGKISFESTVGEGTTFTLELPI